jgi:transcription elongation factor Elf1
MNTETQNEKIARDILAKQPLNTIGVRDVAERYKRLLEYDKHSKCPRCGEVLDKVYVVVKAVRTSMVMCSSTTFDYDDELETQYKCPYCEAEISEKAVEVVFRRNWRGEVK